MGRRRFERAFKLEAAKLVRERGGSVPQAARDLDIHENMLRKWVKDFAADPWPIHHDGRVMPPH
jgi:transposase